MWVCRLIENITRGFQVDVENVGIIEIIRSDVLWYMLQINSLKLLFFISAKKKLVLCMEWINFIVLPEGSISYKKWFA